jgi:hypothetical protein
MFYGDQRLIGHLEWLDEGRTYDGARLSATPTGYFADAFVARVRETLTDNDDQHLFGVYAGAKDWLPGGAVELYAIGFADELEAPGEGGVDGDTGFATLGTRSKLVSDGFDGTVELAAQLGEVRGDSLVAFGAAVVAGYTTTAPSWPLRVAIELDYATGDADPTDGDNNRFQTLVPTNHLHYGYADLAAWSNLAAARLTVRATPAPQWWIQLDVHHLRLASEADAWLNAGGAVIRPGMDGASTHLGEELDLVVSWKPVKGLALQAGWAVFLPGGFVDDTGGGSVANFGYAEAGVSF